MATRIHAVQGMADDALLVDDEGRADDAHLLYAIDFLGLPDAIAAAYFAFCIGQQPHRQSVLVAKLGVRDAIIAADAQHRAVMAKVVFFVVAELDRLLGAPWRIVPRVKEQDHMLAAQ